MSFYGNVTSNTVLTDEVVAVELTVQTYGQEFTGKGWAKKHPKDRPNAEVGLALATSRALLDAAEQLTTYAQERIEQMASRQLATRWSTNVANEMEVSGW